MPNNDLFSTRSPAVAPATARNNAGGTAYEYTKEHALARYAVTGTLNDTFYVTAKVQFAELLKLASACDPSYVAKVAVYARQHGLMKDTPVALVAYLMTLPNKQYFNAAYPYVLNNIGSLRNFVQMVRSGAFGRKSLGSTGKRAVNSVLANMDADKIFWQASSGTADVSTEDLIKLAHPKPLDAEHDALYAYLLGKDYLAESLPETVQAFEKFKAGETTVVPKVDFRRLQNLSLSETQWRDLALNMTWNQLRMNLRNLSRHEVFKDDGFTKEIAARLVDERSIRGSGALPFSLYQSYQAIREDNDIPRALVNAIGEAVDISVLNAPRIEGETLIMVDSSGSMGSRITGGHGGHGRFGQSANIGDLTCSRAAGYFAAGLVKANPNERFHVWAYDTSVNPVTLNPRDSVTTMTTAFPTMGGGTATGASVANVLGRAGVNPKNIIVISDNESWADNGWYDRGTALSSVFEKYRQRKRDAQLVAWDITPGRTSQVSEANRGRQLNVGGFSDSVFTVIGSFLNGGSVGLVETINSISLG